MLSFSSAGWGGCSRHRRDDAGRAVTVGIHEGIRLDRKAQEGRQGWGELLNNVKEQAGNKTLRDYCERGCRQT